MKGVFPLLIVLLLCVTAIYEITGKHIVAAGAVCLAAAVMSGTNLYGYVADNRHFKRDLSYLRTNREIAQTLTAEYTPENSVYAQNTAVRGYSNLLFGRGIYEGVTLDKAIPIAQAKGKRYVIAFTISQGAWNMYDYGDYTVYDLDNSDME
jgi:hypothetical protein